MDKRDWKVRIKGQPSYMVHLKMAIKTGCAHVCVYVIITSVVVIFCQRHMVSEISLYKSLTYLLTD